MKIHKKIVMKMSDFKVIEDDSYEYRGEIAECKGSATENQLMNYRNETPSYQMPTATQPMYTSQYSYLMANPQTLRQEQPSATIRSGGPRYSSESILPYNYQPTTKTGGTVSGTIGGK